jgi:hypothetical protein
VLGISLLLPSPLIDGNNTGFTKHFGGGLFCCFLWLFIMQSNGWRLPKWQEFITLYAFVCMLGVTVELVEILFLEIGYIEENLLDVRTTDTSWDLVANTAGAVVFWVIYSLVEGVRGRS